MPRQDSGKYLEATIYESVEEYLSQLTERNNSFYRQGLVQAFSSEGTVKILTHLVGDSVLAKKESLDLGTGIRITSMLNGCSKQNIPVVRRQTGGGGIFHDHVGDISYSIIAPVSSFSTDISKSYHAMLVPIISAFEQLGISAELAGSTIPALHTPSCYLREIHPAHDILVSGKKISGNAQRRSNDVVIQHGSLTYKYDVDQFALVFSNFNIKPNTIQNHVTSISEQVNATREESIDALTNSFLTWSHAKKGTWTAIELEQANKIAQELFSSEDWTKRT